MVNENARKQVGMIMFGLACGLAVIGLVSVPVDVPLSIASFIFALLFAGLGLACDPL